MVRCKPSGCAALVTRRDRLQGATASITAMTSGAPSRPLPCSDWPACSAVAGNMALIANTG